MNSHKQTFYINQVLVHNTLIMGKSSFVVQELQKQNYLLPFPSYSVQGLNIT
jgi:hypothetical protein